MIQIQIYPPHKTLINQALYKAELTRTHYITNRTLLIDIEDLEKVEKILNKLETSYKVK